MHAFKGRFGTSIATLCIVLALAGSLIQAAHFCELGGTRQTQAGPTAHGNVSGICEICAISHQTSVPTVSSLPFTASVTAQVLLVAVQPHSRLQSFFMDVRPPPSLSF